MAMRYENDRLQAQIPLQQDGQSVSWHRCYHMDKHQYNEDSLSPRNWLLKIKQNKHRLQEESSKITSCTYMVSRMLLLLVTWC